MNLTYKYLIMCALLTPLTVLSQENYTDSTYLSLYNNFISSIKSNDSIKAHFFVKKYKEKAKRESNNVQIATAYKYEIGVDKEGHKTLHLFDSIIQLTKNLHTDHTTIAYYNRGIYYVKNSLYQKAIDNYILAIESNKHNKDASKSLLTNSISRSFASLKLHIGENKEALELLKQSWKYTIEKNYKSIQPSYYYVTMLDLTEAYRKNHYLDSARTYLKLATIDSATIKENKFYELFLYLEGLIECQEGNYKKSIQSLNNIIPYLRANNRFEELSGSRFYLGKAYLAENNMDKAIENFKKVDSIYDITGYLHPETLESYSYLRKWEKDNNNMAGELAYIDKLMKIDSASILNYKYLNKKINKEFDIPLILEEKELLIAELKMRETKNYHIIWIITSSAIVLIVFLIIYYKRKNAILERRFNELLKQDVKNEEKDQRSIEKSIKKLDIPAEIRNTINEKMILFEKNKGYLDPSITITRLAKEIGTNHSYLSLFINNTKNYNFSVYLKKLRVNYAIDRLKIDTVFRKYTIKAIATESGFKGAESFSKEFKKNTGLYPSYFIKKLNELISA